jgi:hypothetical protein
MNNDLNQTELIITCRTVQDAILGERRLLDSGIAVQVMPMPVPLGRACGIALRISPADIERAKDLLGERIKGIFSPQKEGTFTAVFDNQPP